MYGCESWNIKKAECWKTDAFELLGWRILSRVPWTARNSNQSITKEISPEYSLEGVMLKLKLQYFGHLMQITDSLEETLMLKKIEGRRRKGRQRIRRLCGILWTLWPWGWGSSGSWWWAGKPGVLQSIRLQRVGHDWATELNWTAALNRQILIDLKPGNKNSASVWSCTLGVLSLLTRAPCISLKILLLPNNW